MKSLTVSIISSFICHEVMGLDAMIFILSFKPSFSTLLFRFHQEDLSSIAWKKRQTNKLVFQDLSLIPSKPEVRKL